MKLSGQESCKRRRGSAASLTAPMGKGFDQWIVLCVLLWLLFRANRGSVVICAFETSLRSLVCGWLKLST